MIKRRIWIVMLCLIVVIIASTGLMKTKDYLDFLKNKEAVNSYLVNHYDFEYQLVKHRIGKNAYPIGREPDLFVYYDSTNKVYFKIYCYDGEVADYYQEATVEEPSVIE